MFVQRGRRALKDTPTNIEVGESDVGGGAALVVGFCMLMLYVWWIVWVLMMVVMMAVSISSFAQMGKNKSDIGCP